MGGFINTKTKICQSPQVLVEPMREAIGNLRQTFSFISEGEHIALNYKKVKTF